VPYTGVDHIARLQHVSIRSPVFRVNTHQANESVALQATVVE
jgi:hypothetical protein